MRRARQILGPGARRQYVQLTVNLHGIGIDDRAAERFGHIDRERGFPARGGTGDDQNVLVRG